MGPAWVPGPPGLGLNAILRWFWYHKSLPEDKHFALTGTNTCPGGKTGLKTGPGGMITSSCPICWPLLPHTACNGSGSTTPGLCSQHCFPARLIKNFGVHGPTAPPGAGVTWGTPPPLSLVSLGHFTTPLWLKTSS